MLSQLRSRTRSTEALVFSAAVVVALAHAFDDAFLLNTAGVPLTQHALAAGVALVASVLAIVRYDSLRPGLRAATAFVFGVLAVINGGRHVHHIATADLTANDVTGVLALGAGVVLIGLAAWIPFRHRGEGRWLPRLIVPPLVLVAIWAIGMPVGMALTDIHSLEKPVGQAPNAAYKTVHFTASDGVKLEGWYRPSRNGATVLVIPGGGSNRMGPLRHAKMLERQGYGVLVYDARGLGHSEGTPNSYGWDWDKDIDAALAYLKGRDEVDPSRIGALGLSTGADVLIQVAGQRHDLKAVVADGQRVNGITPITPFMTLEFATARVTSGSKPGPVLEDIIKRVTSPLLLVSAGPPEKQFGETYDRAAGDRPVELWYLPDVAHTAAIRQAAPEYERRVTTFFDDALTGR